jgi:hypothetical protein
MSAIDRVVAGGVIIDPDLVGRLIKRSRVGDPLRLLSERELQTLALMAEGHHRCRRADPDANARVRAVLTYLRHTGQIAR